MKILFKLVIIFAFVFTQIACKEKTKLESKIHSPRMIKILNNSEIIADTIQNYLSIRIYKIDNGTGSAGYPSSEVSFNLLVAVSGFDEEPEQNLFEIGPFLYPKFKEWLLEDSVVGFKIEEGESNYRIQQDYIVNLSHIKLVNN